MIYLQREEFNEYLYHFINIYYFIFLRRFIGIASKHYL